MRGVLLTHAPGCRLVDIAHHIPRGDLAKAPCFPLGTVHLVVVDPGVGTERRGLAMQAGGHFFVGPDNGAFEATLDHLGGPTAPRLLGVPADASSTFPGRDVFAPAAAALAAGQPIDGLGPVAGPRICLPAGASGAVDDRFGNLITDLVPCGPVVLGPAGVHLDGPPRAYGAVDSGELVVVVGSEGTLEVAVRDGSAADRLGAAVGTAVTCEVRPAAGESAS